MGALKGMEKPTIEQLEASIASLDQQAAAEREALSADEARYAESFIGIEGAVQPAPDPLAMRREKINALQRARTQYLSQLAELRVKDAAEKRVETELATRKQGDTTIAARRVYFQKVDAAGRAVAAAVAELTKLREMAPDVPDWYSPLRQDEITREVLIRLAVASGGIIPPPPGRLNLQGLTEHLKAGGDTPRIDHHVELLLTGCKATPAQKDDAA